MSVERIARNSVYNLASGAVSALVAVALPPILIRVLGRHEFSVWVLVLQFGVYLNYLNLGVQTGIGRFVAASSAGDKSAMSADSALNSGVALLSFFALIGGGAVYIAAAYVPFFYESIPSDSRTEFMSCLPWVLGCYALTLPISGINGYFSGVRNTLQPLVNNLLLKAAMFIFIMAAALMLGSLTALTLALVFSYVIAIIHYVRLVFGQKAIIPLRWRCVSWEDSKVLLRYCSSVAVWTFSMLLINGFSALLVARFDFNKLALFSISSSLVAVFYGVYNSIFSNLMPELAASSHSPEQRSEVIIGSTHASSTILMFFGLLMIVALPILVSLFLGEVYESGDELVPQLLVLAFIVRNTCAPYAMHLLATFQQKKGMYTGLFEGGVTISFSYVFAAMWGVKGVAVAACLGALLGVVCTLLVVFRLDGFVKLDWREFVYRGPLFSWIFAVPTVVSATFFSGVLGVRYGLNFVILVLTLAVAWRWLLNSEERLVVKKLCGKVKVGK